MHYLLFILLGLGASAHVVVINIADYPPPRDRRPIVERAARRPGCLVGCRRATPRDDFWQRPDARLGRYLGVIGAGLGASAATALASGFAKKTHIGVNAQRS